MAPTREPGRGYGTGRRIEVRCGCIFHFRGDRLVRETVYFDRATLLAQI